MSKRQTKPDPDLAKWCEVLSVPSATPDKVPPGWFTVEQIAVQIGKSESWASQLVRKAVRAGKCEVARFRIPTAGTVRPVPHYRLK